MQERGATIYAEFLGGSFTCDAYHMTEPHPEGNIRNLYTDVYKHLGVCNLAKLITCAEG